MGVPEALSRWTPLTPESELHSVQLFDRITTVMKLRAVDLEPTPLETKSRPRAVLKLETGGVRRVHLDARGRNVSKLESVWLGEYIRVQNVVAASVEVSYFYLHNIQLSTPAITARQSSLHRRRRHYY
jgi:hypothetical protein